MGRSGVFRRRGEEETDRGLCEFEEGGVIMTSKASKAAIAIASDQNLTGYVVELCKIHLRSYPQNKNMGVWIEYARALTELSRFSEAENAFDQALQNCEDERQWQSIIYSSRGDLNKRRGNYAEAEKWYLKSIEATPEHIWNHIFLGVVLFRRGDLKASEERQRTAIEIGGEETDEAYLNLGGVLMAQERYEEARECYLRAIELCPDYKQAKLRLRDVNKILKIRPTATDSSVAEVPSE